MTLTLFVQFLKIRKNRKVIYFFGMVITLLILYEVAGPRKIKEEYHWDVNTVRNITENIHRNSQIIPSDFCQYMTILLVLVQSKPSNFANRDAIRTTWKKDNNNLFFVLGRSTDVDLQNRISEESTIHGDVIVLDFIDSYANLTLKSIVMLKLATLCALQSSYLLKTDDDVLVNINRIEEMLFGRRFPEDLLMGHLKCAAPSMRTRKWYQENPYSRYLSRHAYLMSMSVAQRLYQKALITPLSHLDDIYVTGICAKKAGITLEHNEFFTKRYVLRSPCLLRQAYTITKVTVEEMVFFSKALKDEHNMEDCRKVFTTFRLFLHWAFPFKDTPFGYRERCK